MLQMLFESCFYLYSYLQKDRLILVQEKVTGITDGGRGRSSAGKSSVRDQPSGPRGVESSLERGDKQGKSSRIKVPLTEAHAHQEEWQAHGQMCNSWPLLYKRGLFLGLLSFPVGSQHEVKSE